MARIYVQDIAEQFRVWPKTHTEKHRKENQLVSEGLAKHADATAFLLSLGEPTWLLPSVAELLHAVPF